MKKITNVYADELLIVQTEDEKKLYEKESFISFFLKEGFNVLGIIKEIKEKYIIIEFQENLVKYEFNKMYFI